MTVQPLDDLETVRLWKDPDARWELDQECPAHPSGEITFDRSGAAAGPTLQMLGIVEPGYASTFTPFAPPSVSGPCRRYQPTTDDLS